MLDINGKEILVNHVVEIRGAYSKSDNSLWVVERVYDDGLWLQKLNKNLTKSKGVYTTKSWPLKSYSNDSQKRYEIDCYNKQHAEIEMLCPYVEPEKKEKKNSNELRILKNGIRKGDHYYPCYYWVGRDNIITVYAKEYGYNALPAELGNIINESDGRVDYFEKSRCYLKEGDRYYNEVLARIQKD